MFGFNDGKIPRWIIEATFIIPAMILFPLFLSNHNIFRASIIEWMLLYAVSLIIWRMTTMLTMPLVFIYGITDIIRPAYFIGLLFIITMGLDYIAPNYRAMGYIHVDSEEMAKNCPEAKWTLYVRYSYYHGHLNGTETIDLVGKSEEVEKMSKTYMSRFFNNNPEYTYTDHTLHLYELPEELVHKNYWPDFMHKNRERSTSEKFDKANQKEENDKLINKRR